MEAATLRILVLDGKSGKPVSGRVVEVFSKEPASAPVVSGVTDQKGVLSIATPLPKEIAVHIKGRYLCTGNNQATSVHNLDDILSVGVVETNLCNYKVLASPEPGELILFVRRESAKEFLD
jgi:hypothetical protein